MCQSQNTIELYHSKLFSDKHNLINGIESFWNYAKWHLYKYNGAPKENYSLFL